MVPASEESFGGRLRRERERRQIALSSISANSKISVSLFEALERDDVARWPVGIYRRSFIRAYAAAIGLDGKQALGWDMLNDAAERLAYYRRVIAAAEQTFPREHPSASNLCTSVCEYECCEESCW